jgi:hypothetical protein
MPGIDNRGARGVAIRTRSAGHRMHVPGHHEAESERGRVRRQDAPATRCAYVAIELNRHPERAGPRLSKKPGKAMNIATAPRPELNQAAQNEA